MNNDESLLKLKALATLEMKLWENFNEAERSARIGLRNLKKQFEVWRVLKKEKVGICRYYPVFQLLPFLAALSTPFFDGKGLAGVFFVYVVALVLAAFTYNGFSNAYTYVLTGRRDLVRKAFGIDQISNRTFVMFDRLAGKGIVGIDTKMLDSIIKLVKAAQEHEAATLGYGEFAHRNFINYLFTLPFILPALYFSNKEKADFYIERVRSAYDAGHFRIDFFISVIILLLCAAFFLYVFLYGERAAIKKKKRYLLMLNVLRESYVEIVEPNNDEIFLIERAIKVINRAKVLCLEKKRLGSIGS